MKTGKYILWLLCVAAFLPSCVRCPAGTSTGLPKDYNLAYQEIYGHCYDSIPYAVVALDLYSEGLTLNKNHRIQGTGYNLYLSDIFVPDSLLADGEYTSIANDQSHIVPFTFLPGQDYEGLPHGLYLLHIEEDKIIGIQVLDSGTMVVKTTEDGLTDLQFTLHYKNAYGQHVTYTPHFEGALIPWQKQ